MCGRIKVEHRFCFISGNRELDICAAGCAIFAVVYRPTAVDRDFRLVIACRNVSGRVRVRAVAVRVLQQRAQTVRLPVAGTADLVLKAAGDVGEQRVHAVRDPVRRVAVNERDRCVLIQHQRDIRAARLGVQTVIDVPAAIQRDFVFVAAGRQVEGRRPELILLVVGEGGRFTFGLPVTGTAEDALNRAGNDDEAWLLGLRQDSQGSGR